MPATEIITRPDEPKLVRGLGLIDSTHDRRRFNDRFGHFHRLGRYFATSGIDWLVVDGVGRHRSADGHRGFELRRVGGHDARAGGQYVYLREAYSPLWGFLYGWTVFLVIQTAPSQAVAVAFSLVPGSSGSLYLANKWIIPPINLSTKYAVSLSSQQLIAVLMILLLTYINTRGLKIGKLIQNVFTSAKTLSLVALIFIGLFLGRNAAVIRANFSHIWTPARFRRSSRICHF